MVLFQIVALTAAVSFFVSRLTSSVKARVLVPLAFFIWPQAGASTVLLSRDVLFCAAFLVIAGYLSVWFGETHPPSRARSSTVPISIGLFFLVILRWNGAIIAILVVVLIWLLAKNLRLIVLPLIGLISGCAILLFPPLSTNQGGKALRTGGQAMDIAWGLREDPESFSPEEIKLIEDLGGVAAWSQSQRDCNNSAMPLLNSVFGEGGYWQTLNLESTSKKIQSIWIKHATRSPDVLIEGRLCKMRGLVWLGSSWPQSPVVSYKLKNSSIVETNYWLELSGERPIPPLFKEPHVELAGDFVNAYGQSRLGRLLANPLPYLMLPIFRTYRRRSLSRRDLALVSLLIFVVLSILVGGVGYEPRYIWPATAVLVLSFLTDISRWSQRKTQGWFRQNRKVTSMVRSAGVEPTTF